MNDGTHVTGKQHIRGIEYSFSGAGVWDGMTQISYATVLFTIEKSLKATQYGGFYVDDGMAVIMAVNVDEVRNIAQDLYPNYAPILFVKCEYSKSKLEKVKKQLLTNMDVLSINSVETDIQHNKVLIYTEKTSVKLVEFINKLIDGECIIIREESFSTIILD